MKKETSKLSDNKALNIPIVMRSVSDFKDEVINKLRKFYDYGNDLGYSNSELSRIRSCIRKVEEMPV